MLDRCEPVLTTLGRGIVDTWSTLGFLIPSFFYCPYRILKITKDWISSGQSCCGSTFWHLILPFLSFLLCSAHLLERGLSIRPHLLPTKHTEAPKCLLTVADCALFASWEISYSTHLDQGLDPGQPSGGWVLDDNGIKLFI